MIEDKPANPLIQNQNSCKTLKNSSMCMTVWLPACKCTMCLPGSCGGQEVVSDLMELELEMSERCHVGAGS